MASLDLLPSDRVEGGAAMRHSNGCLLRAVLILLCYRRTFLKDFKQGSDSCDFLSENYLTVVQQKGWMGKKIL